MQSIYYLKMAILESHLPMSWTKEKEEIKSMAEFISLYYCKWFLTSSLPSVSPRADFEAILEMRDYSKIDERRKQIAHTVLESISHHSWYHDPSLVVLSLCDGQLEPEVREKIAMAIDISPRPEEHLLGRPEARGFLDPRKEKEFWGVSEERKGKQKLRNREWKCEKWSKTPQLADLVSPRSHMLFDILGFTPEDLVWLRKPSSSWESYESYSKLKDFIDKMFVVNDPAERSIGMVQSYIDISRDEELRQDLFISMEEHRKTKKATTKSKLSEIK